MGLILQDLFWDHCILHSFAYGISGFFLKWFVLNIGSIPISSRNALIPFKQDFFLSTLCYNPEIFLKKINVFNEKETVFVMNVLC